MGDQISNSIRVEETGYGHRMSLLDVNEQELRQKLDQLINNPGLRTKWKKASERIQRENRIGQVVDHIATVVSNLN